MDTYLSRDEVFEKFYSVYPRKRRDGRAASFKAWVKACKKAEPEVILSAAQAYADSNPGEYSKGTVAWLNAERFFWDYTPAEQKQDPAVAKSRYFDMKKRYAKPYHDFMSESEVAEFKKLETTL